MREGGGSEYLLDDQMLHLGLVLVVERRARECLQQFHGLAEVSRKGGAMGMIGRLGRRALNVALVLTTARAVMDARILRAQRDGFWRRLLEAREQARERAAEADGLRAMVEQLQAELTKAEAPMGSFWSLWDDMTREIVGRGLPVSPLTQLVGYCKFDLVPSRVKDPHDVRRAEIAKDFLAALPGFLEAVRAQRSELRRAIAGAGTERTPAAAE